MTWQLHAACRGLDPEPWFHDGPANTPRRERLTRQAIRVCATCPVQRACLEDALATPERSFEGTGIWGGLTPKERRVIRRFRDRNTQTQGAA